MDTKNELMIVDINNISKELRSMILYYPYPDHIFYRSKQQRMKSTIERFDARDEAGAKKLLKMIEDEKPCPYTITCYMIGSLSLDAFNVFVKKNPFDLTKKFRYGKMKDEFTLLRYTMLKYNSGCRYATSENEMHSRRILHEFIRLFSVCPRIERSDIQIGDDELVCDKGIPILRKLGMA